MPVTLGQPQGIVKQIAGQARILKRLRHGNPTAPSTIRLIASGVAHAELSHVSQWHRWIKNEFASHHGRLPVGG
ncbi:MULTISPECIES: hypothetical protein [unclassified Bradyrhizobium]